MKSALRKLNAFVKSFILFLRPGVLFNFLSKPFLFLSNLLRLTKWISQQPRKGILNDFYTPGRDHNKRVQLYEYLIEKEKLADAPIDYLEFGVSRGHSFRWWLGANRNDQSKFYGFDTFEGLPEDWGLYDQGDMAAGIPQIEGQRHEFIKGLFQQTVLPFLSSHNLNNGRRKLIHLDADLFSSTLYALTTLAPYIKQGDILLFDEFNVPNHEYYAYRIFCESYYKEFELLGAVNNYYQVAFKVK